MNHRASDNQPCRSLRSRRTLPPGGFADTSTSITLESRKCHSTITHSWRLPYCTERIIPACPPTRLRAASLRRRPPASRSSGYNEACAAGVDRSFGRNPETLTPVATAPFYVVSGSPLLGWSSGGPRRDGHSRVFDTAGEPIPGLYAAGAVSSTYSAAKDGGFHIADAFGRVAGAHAAKRATAGD